MSLSTAGAVKAALETIYASFAAEATKPGVRAGVEALNEVARVLNTFYAVTVDVAITDATDAGVAELIAASGELEDYAVGDTFRNTGTGDLTDNALATAKGSALAANDIFSISGADAVTYLGNNADGPVFDMDGETSQDFLDF